MKIVILFTDGTKFDDNGRGYEFIYFWSDSEQRNIDNEEYFHKFKQFPTEHAKEEIIKQMEEDFEKEVLDIYPYSD